MILGGGGVLGTWKLERNFVDHFYHHPCAPPLIPWGLHFLGVGLQFCHMLYGFVVRL
jgi:hypothetical protein